MYTKIKNRTLSFVIVFSFFLAEKVSAQTCPAGTAPMSGICVPNNTGLSSSSITSILGNLMLWLFGIFGFLAIIAFVISGLQYLTAAGDEGQAETAKQNAKYSAIGIVVALSGFIIIRAVDQALNGNPNF